MCNDIDVIIFLSRLEFRILWVKYPDLVANLAPIDERDEFAVHIIKVFSVSFWRTHLKLP